MQAKAKVGLKLNVSYQLRDKNGNLKPLFQENFLWKFLHKLGVINPKWNWVQKVPFLFGSWKTDKAVANLVTDAGKAAVAGLINGVITDFFDYIALGTGTTAAAAGDTTLGTETSASGLARAASTNSRVTTDVSNDTAQLSKAFSSLATAAITESGVFSAAAAGTLLARQVFSAINVVSGDELTITWKIDVD